MFPIGSKALSKIQPSSPTHRCVNPKDLHDHIGYSPDEDNKLRKILTDKEDMILGNDRRTLFEEEDELGPSDHVTLSDLEDNPRRNNEDSLSDQDDESKGILRKEDGLSDEEDGSGQMNLSDEEDGSGHSDQEDNMRDDDDVHGRIRSKKSNPSDQEDTYVKRDQDNSSEQEGELTEEAFRRQGDTRNSSPVSSLTAMSKQRNKDGREIDEAKKEHSVILENVGESMILSSSSTLVNEDSDFTNSTFEGQSPIVKNVPRAEHKQYRSGMDDDREDETMEEAGFSKQSSNSMDVDDFTSEDNGEMEKSSKSKDNSDIGMESDRMPLDDEPSADLAPPFELRRSSRNGAGRTKPTLEMLRSPLRVKRKPVFRKAVTHLQAGEFYCSI